MDSRKVIFKWSTGSSATVIERLRLVLTQHSVVRSLQHLLGISCRVIAVGIRKPQAS